ncbi:MAG TPA: hypothetical protein VGC08_07440 [Pedobacter sp.]
MSQSSIIALLPVQKEFSYYLKNRNFLPFDGKPMYQYMIAKLLAVPQIERLVVNTDSEEVKAFCQSNDKITIVDRPDTLTGENITSDMITAYDLQKVPGEHFIEVQSFNPLLTSRSIEAAINQYFDYIFEGYFDSVFSMQRYELRGYDLDKRELNNEYQFVIFESRILHLFNRTNFLNQGKKKIGKMAMMTEIGEVENTSADSDINYELTKLVYANQDKFPHIFRSGL